MEPTSVLLTGASGFIGSGLLDALCATFGEHQVIVLSSKPARRGRSIIYDGAWKIDADGRALAAEAQIVLHAGAYTPKCGAAANDLRGCNGNVSFTAELLELDLPRLKKLLFLSTLDVYAPTERIDEDSPVGPGDLYGWSKLYCEQMIAQYARQRQVVTQILRVGHVYGPGEEQYSKVLPIAIRNIVEGRPVELWGDGSELRSFIYIGDVLKAIMAAVALPTSLGVTNIVGGQPVAVRELLTQVISLSGQPVQLVHRNFNGTPRSFVFDNRKLRGNLLAHETPLREGLMAELAHQRALAGKA